MNYKLGIRDVVYNDLDEISQLDLMDDDLKELYFAGFTNTPITLIAGCLMSMNQDRCVCRCYYELETGRILGVYGITYVGTIWFLSSKELLSHYREFTKRTQAEFKYFTKGCGLVYNYVHSRHRRAIRWLKWLGFKIVGNPVYFMEPTELYFRMEYYGE